MKPGDEITRVMGAARELVLEIGQRVLEEGRVELHLYVLDVKRAEIRIIVANTRRIYARNLLFEALAARCPLFVESPFRCSIDIEGAPVGVEVTSRWENPQQPFRLESRHVN